MPESDRSFQGSGPSPSGTAYLQNETMLRDDTLTQKPAITDLVTSLTSRRLISNTQSVCNVTRLNSAFRSPQRFLDTYPLSVKPLREPLISKQGGAAIEVTKTITC